MRAGLRRLHWWVRMAQEPGVWTFLIVAIGISAGFLFVDMPRAAVAVWASVFIGACFAWLGDFVRP